MNELLLPARLSGHVEVYQREDIENPESLRRLVHTSRPGGQELLGVEFAEAVRVFDNPIAGGAETFTEEGLTRVLNIFPRNNVAITDPLFMGLFTSQTASTVPAKTATGGASPSGWTEVTGGGYARVSTAGSNWPAPAASGSGVRTTMTGTGMSFVESTGAYSAAVNGFFMASASASGAGDTTIFFANFSDTQAITVNAAGYTIRVAAFWHYDV